MTYCILRGILHSYGRYTCVHQFRNKDTPLITLIILFEKCIIIFAKLSLMVLSYCHS